MLFWSKNTRLSIYFLSENALTIEFGNEINDDLQQKIRNFNQFLLDHPFPGFSTTVPAYASLSVFFDPLQVISAAELPGLSCFEKVSNYLNNLNDKIKRTSAAPAEIVTIPVCYGGSMGPDLEGLAALHHLTEDDVIQLHSKAVYQVYMIGFVPGFAYLGGLNKLLATPRKLTPSPLVPAGSVGIAGEQTGIYPLETPGGWQIIGRTPLKLFDAAWPKPSLLTAGDRVVFKPIDLEEYNRLKNNHAHPNH
ncbi:5-oxoprolinase subunit PxpB [Mucilaginibacter paludis]|uniref:Carboxyltransferase domain-containing protein n=1 Tax=Mucilaginibacter paludis DSM 18603 TaxID=714943 RepID=H1YGF2_9SPHI|nr:5-oxoprolinase subunit PxpB [Mucilaginibacter paludis]EHQ24504.1 Conserved hypothetical protein CHP00370 [Mucilaginibacter paludis DSM 18603]